MVLVFGLAACMVADFQTCHCNQLLAACMVAPILLRCYLPAHPYLLLTRPVPPQS